MVVSYAILLHWRFAHFLPFMGKTMCIAHTAQYDVMLVGDLNAQVDFHFSLIANIYMTSLI